MHELSIAVNIVDIALKEAKKASAEKITDVHLDVGALSGIITEALDFAMQMAVKDSILEDAKIHIREIAGRARCEECAKEFPLDDLFETCPHCSSLKLKIIDGQELKIRSLNVA